MNKNENVILDWSGDGGIAKATVLPQKTTPIEQGERSGYFDDAFGRDDEKVRAKIAEIEANNRLVESLKKQIEELDERIDTANRQNAQLQAEIQLMKAEAGDESALAVHEKHAFARWYFESGYSIQSFCKLYFQCLPCEQLPDAFGTPFRRMMVSLKEFLSEDERGMTLCGYRGDDLGAFPVDAYRVACTRLRWRVNVPIFTTRERYDLEAIEREYEELSEIKQAKYLGEKRAKTEKHWDCKKRSLEDSPEKMSTVRRVLEENGYRFENKGDLYTAIELSAGIRYSTARDWVKTYARKYALDINHDIEYWGKRSTKKPRGRCLN